MLVLLAIPFSCINYVVEGVTNTLTNAAGGGASSGTGSAGVGLATTEAEAPLDCVAGDEETIGPAACAFTDSEDLLGRLTGP